MLLHYILLIFLFFLPIFLLNQSFYQNVNLPFFSLKASLLPICFFIHNLFLLLSMIHYGKRNSYPAIDLKWIRQYIYFFLLVFFILFVGTFKTHLFLGSIMTFLLFSNQVFLYEEISLTDEKSTFFLRLPLLWNFYFIIVSITTFLLNIWF